jgi:L-ascorbate metabolism protein UlaG (beta-lactamase superfamily)
LWASFIIKSPNHAIYVGGDSGYGRHFKAIGERYDPFDLAMLKLGQYNENWRYIHMMPEEAHHSRTKDFRFTIKKRA